MNNAQRKRKIFISAMAGMMMIPGSTIEVLAAEDVPEQVSPLPVVGIESVLEQSFETEVKENIDLYLVQDEQGEYLNRAFSNVSDFAYIRTAPDETSEWTGKLYSDSTVTVLEYAGDWTKIQSGNVEGYVPAEALYTGEEAQECAADYIEIKATVEADVLNVRDGQGTENEILTQVFEEQMYPVTGEEQEGWYPVRVGETNGWVCGEYVEIEEICSYAESKEEEEIRLAEEAQQLSSAGQTGEGVLTNGEAAADGEVSVCGDRPVHGEVSMYGEVSDNTGTNQTTEASVYISEQGVTGQAVINFACQFIGNPYVWGGTSLTNGADCSGFVQSVYANFGISLPRTTWDMESVGYAVSYEEAQMGDLVLYDGHVGLYMGDGTIVNAMNEVDGIGICSATYAPIVTIRRVL
ncbi:MAG: C40 family peptidase [Ruminococcus sp.]|nr:C40 family peptidase [Ruminococcus sp.]